MTICVVSIYDIRNYFRLLEILTKSINYNNNFFCGLLNKKNKTDCKINETKQPRIYCVGLLLIIKLKS